ncbi:MAG: single-stranded-DNA-specific exonuclease RecJ [Candidatus Niyogibacteria bacterium CG10_big_fil_rev_8_21_14_0_10_46_36]|uniref:Single-stranded-DNA-specific exonuclease RecJ n=1 Tax=Candidatus Niyogibacteria bacterium CG10_big_fil_rev_8_21_14_0_10_46_36 TaxID=1974726 RepID=A0A2H0TEJ6_9BACT|nr:MAG: single-stranded-DNA-specific exonuclease RecJ [Candidatus Niyogibacteria bacterium CG10_big_fil_rev_8_21_14_0_10_46_36]
MKKQWQIKNPYPEPYAEQMRGDELTLQLLFNRGIHTQEEADAFFSPAYERDTHDPFLLPDMEKAVKRFLDAMKKNERILIFSDYDADGVCGSIVFSDFFRFVGYENFFLYNPDRYKEGYGLTVHVMEAVLEQKPSLVVTVDTGIGDIEGVRTLQEKGIDVIVTDHHLPGDELPRAFAVIDHKRKDSAYPFPELCGTGTAFKFVQALFQRGDWPVKEGYEKWMLDVVAIATVADMVPLRDENRMLVHWGLEVLKKNRRPGLRILLEQQPYISLPRMQASDIAFTLGPLINSAGRIDHANTAVELLRADNEEEARWLASRLQDANAERKRMTQDVVSLIQAKYADRDMPAVIVLGEEGWFPGVLGIAASRLVEEYARPVFLFGKGEGETFKGSCRSDGSANLVELMKRAGEDLFTAYGGHAMAAGFTIAGGREKDMERALNDAYASIDKKENLFGELHIEKELSIDEVAWDIYATLSRFEPFGEGNPNPVFLFSGVLIENVRTFGNVQSHLELRCKQSSGNAVKAVFFGGGSGAEMIKRGATIDLAASIEYSSFRNTGEIRLRIVDYRAR